MIKSFLMAEQELIPLIYRSFGEAIRQEREKSGLTQGRLGELVGLSRTSITNIEQGRQHVPLHHLFLMAKALQVNPRDILPSFDDDKEKSIFDWIKTAMPSDTDKNDIQFITRFASIDRK